MHTERTNKIALKIQANTPIDVTNMIRISNNIYIANHNELDKIEITVNTKTKKTYMHLAIGILKTIEYYWGES